jgi:hypothetical protein
MSNQSHINRKQISIPPIPKLIRYKRESSNDTFETKDITEDSELIKQTQKFQIKAIPILSNPNIDNTLDPFKSIKHIIPKIPLKPGNSGRHELDSENSIDHSLKKNISTKSYDHGDSSNVDQCRKNKRLSVPKLPPIKSPNHLSCNSQNPIQNITTATVEESINQVKQKQDTTISKIDIPTSLPAIKKSCDQTEHIKHATVSLPKLPATITKNNKQTILVPKIPSKINIVNKLDEKPKDNHATISNGTKTIIIPKSPIKHITPGTGQKKEDTENAVNNSKQIKQSQYETSRKSTESPNISENDSNKIDILIEALPRKTFKLDKVLIEIIKNTKSIVDFQLILQSNQQLQKLLDVDFILEYLTIKFSHEHYQSQNIFGPEGVNILTGQNILMDTSVCQDNTITEKTNYYNIEEKVRYITTDNISKYYLEREIEIFPQYQWVNGSPTIFKFKPIQRFLNKLLSGVEVPKALISVIDKIYYLQLLNEVSDTTY